MVLVVPDEFRSEVLGCSEGDLDDLLAAGIAFCDRKTELSTVRKKLEEAGWSPGFSDWYATRIEADGPNIELRVRPKAKYQEEAEEYGLALRNKSKMSRMGWNLVACSIAVRLVSAMASTADSPITGVAAIVLFVAQLILMYKGLFMILDAKGQSRWWALVGIFVVFVRDKNVLIPPSKTSGFVREGSAALSDW